MIHRAVFSRGFWPARLRLLLICGTSQPAAAQDYPTRPITLIVPYPAGGGVDVMGRWSGRNCRWRSASRSSSRTAAAPAA